MAASLAALTIWAFRGLKKQRGAKGDTLPFFLKAPQKAGTTAVDAGVLDTLADHQM